MIFGSSEATAIGSAKGAALLGPPLFAVAVESCQAKPSLELAGASSALADKSPAPEALTDLSILSELLHHATTMAFLGRDDKDNDQRQWLRVPSGTRPHRLASPSIDRASSGNSRPMKPELLQLLQLHGPGKLSSPPTTQSPPGVSTGYQKAVLTITEVPGCLVGGAVYPTASGSERGRDKARAEYQMTLDHR